MAGFSLSDEEIQRNFNAAGFNFGAPSTNTNWASNFSVPSVSAPSNAGNDQTNLVSNLLAALGQGQQSLNPFRLGPNETPSFWNKITGYSQNGQNYSGIGGSLWNAAAGGIQAYLSYQAYKAQRDLARDQFNLQKAQFEDAKKRYWDKWDRQNTAREDAMM